MAFNENDITPMCEECIEYTSKRCVTPKTRKEALPGVRPCRDYRLDYSVCDANLSPVVNTESVTTFRSQTAIPNISNTPKASIRKEAAKRPRLGLRQEAEKMFAENKTKDEVRTHLIAEFKKLGRDDAQALKNANSTIWNALNGR